eukprot:677891-Rhodomonas_salina.2
MGQIRGLTRLRRATMAWPALGGVPKQGKIVEHPPVLVRMRVVKEPDVLHHSVRPARLSCTNLWMLEQEVEKSSRCCPRSSEEEEGRPQRVESIRDRVKEFVLAVRRFKSLEVKS